MLLVLLHTSNLQERLDASLISINYMKFSRTWENEIDD